MLPEGEKKAPEIELRSEEMNDILGRIPPWIVRWGMVLMIITVTLILLGSWWFKYPDEVTASIQVTTENPPYNAIARSDGKIKTILVADNQNIAEGQVLAIIENPASYDDVIMLQQQLLEFRKSPSFLKGDSLFVFKNNLMLGEIQSVYAGFLKLYNDLTQYYQLDYYDQKINSLRQEINRYKDYSKRLAVQSRILEQEKSLTLSQYKRDSSLLLQSVIPEADFELSKSKLLQKQYAYEQSKITQASNDIQIAKLEQQILDLELTRNDETGKLISANLEALDNLNAAIADWMQKYVLRSSVEGVVSFTRIWSENQNVRAGDIVMSVIPDNQGEIIGKISLPLSGSGKVKPGQRVNIKFTNFPHLEYGMVKGIIRSVSLVTADNAYSVIVDLPDGLQTNYNIKLDFNQDMQGNAEIITEDKRLLDKIINPVKSVIFRQKQLKSES